jgi:hypothetical protein
MQEISPFALGVLNTPALETVRKLAANGTILCDSTYGMTNLHFSMTTLMVIDSHGHGLPFAFVLHSSSTADAYVNILDAARRVLGDTVTPKYIMIDDAPAEISAVGRSQWGQNGTKVALCQWHAQRSWTEALIRRVKTDGRVDKTVKTQIFDQLVRIMKETARSCAVFDE